MIIFGTLFSPFVRKVHLVAAEKGLRVEIGNGDPGAPTAEFLAASPFRKMPAMVDGNVVLADSTAIATYLDARHPVPLLYPAEPEMKARAVWFEEVADTIFQPAGLPVILNRFILPVLRGRIGDEEQATRGVEALEPALAWLELQAPADG